MSCFSFRRSLSCQRITLHKNLFFSYVLNSVITIILLTAVANNQELLQRNPVSLCVIINIILLLQSYFSAKSIGAIPFSSVVSVFKYLFSSRNCSLTTLFYSHKLESDAPGKRKATIHISYACFSFSDKLQSVPVHTSVPVWLQLLLDAVWGNLLAHSHRGGCVCWEAASDVVLSSWLGYVAHSCMFCICIIC